MGTSGMYLAGYLCYGILPYSAPMMIAPIPKVLAIMIGHGLIDVATAAQILATSTIPGLYETMCGIGN